MSATIKPKRPSRSLEPANNISSIFTARRDLQLTTRQVVRGSGLSVEECDLLISLYGARVLGWDDIEHDARGYVTFQQLEEFVVHNPSLLSRRLRKLAVTKPPLLEIEGASLASGLHFNAKRVRITAEGVQRIGPVWKRFQQMSVKLLEGISPRLLEAHLEVNNKISARIRALRSGLNDLILDKPQIRR